MDHANIHKEVKGDSSGSVAQSEEENSRDHSSGFRASDARPLLPKAAFFMGDLRDGLPMLNMQAAFLISDMGYSEKQIGVLFLVFGLAQFLCMTPAGYALDYSKNKIRWVQSSAIGIAVLTIVAISTAEYGMKWLMIIYAVQGAWTSVLSPGFNGITLGIVGSTGFTHQVSRNRMMNHIGTALVVAVGSLIAYLLFPNIGLLFVVSPLSALGVWYFLRQIIPTHVNVDAARALILESPTLTEYEMAEHVANVKKQATELTRTERSYQPPIQSLNDDQSSSSSAASLSGNGWRDGVMGAGGTRLPPPSEVAGPRRFDNYAQRSSSDYSMYETNANQVVQPGLDMDEMDISIADSKSSAPSFRFGRSGRREASNNKQAQTPLAVLLDPKLTVFLVITFFFHLANSSVLPLVMQSLALLDAQAGILLSGLCILIAQGFMCFFAKICGDYSPYWGRKKLYLAGLSALCLRCYILTFLLSAEESVATEKGKHIIKACILSTQILDSAGAGLIGTLQVLVTSDISGGTGRFSLLMGVVTACMCLGATISGYLGQALAQDYGYDAAFSALGVLSILPLIMYILCMPETLPEHLRPQRRRRRIREMLRRFTDSRKNLLKHHPHRPPASPNNPQPTVQLHSHVELV